MKYNLNTLTISILELEISLYKDSKLSEVLKDKNEKTSVFDSDLWAWAETYTFSENTIVNELKNENIDEVTLNILKNILHTMRNCKMDFARFS